MIRTLKEWREYCAAHGTSGDMVYDILSDWEDEIRMLRKEIESLREGNHDRNQQ